MGIKRDFAITVRYSVGDKVYMPDAQVRRYGLKAWLGRVLGVTGWAWENRPGIYQCTATSDRVTTFELKGPAIETQENP